MLLQKLNETDIAASVRSNFATLVEAMAIGRTPKAVVYSELFEDPIGPWATMIHQSVFGESIDDEVAAAQEGWERIFESSQ